MSSLEYLCEIYEPRKSGMGLPHSKTSRTRWHAGFRASVLECGSPMPLFDATLLAPICQ